MLIQDSLVTSLNQLDPYINEGLRVDSFYSKLSCATRKTVSKQINHNHQIDSNVFRVGRKRPTLH